MMNHLVSDLKELVVFTENQIKKVLQFERDNPDIFDGQCDAKLPMERGGWEVEKFFLNGNELLVTVSFTGYEYNHQICLPAFDETWADKRIQNYIVGHGLILQRRQAYQDQQRQKDLDTLAALKAKYEND